MLMKLKPGVPVLWRAKGECQIGYEEARTVRLSGLTPAELRIVESLEAGSSRGRVRQAALRAGMGLTRLDTLLAALADAGVMQPEPPAWADDPARRVPGHLGSDARAWDLVGDLAGWPRVAERARLHVEIHGGDALGVRVASLLANAGVGHIAVVDDNLVTAADVAPGGYSDDQVGLTRAAAAAALVSAAVPPSTTRSPDGTTTSRPREGADPDFVVVTSALVGDPVRTAALARRDLGHLVVVTEATGVVIGPLVRPGASPCLRCLHLELAERDARWPVIAAQLYSRGLDGAGGTESLTIATAAGIVAGEVLDALDGGRPITQGAQLDVRVGRRIPSLRPIVFHPACGCTDLDAAEPGRTELPANGARETEAAGTEPREAGTAARQR